LLLRGGNETKVVLSVLLVIFCSDRVAGGVRIASELLIFLTRKPW